MRPVRKQLRRFVALCDTDDEYRRKIGVLIRASKSEEWRVVVEILWSIKNELAIELLESSKYTEESTDSKDVTQKVYHNISEWIDFLTQPTKWIAKKGRLQFMLQKLKGDKPEKEKQHG